MMTTSIGTIVPSRQPTECQIIPPVWAIIKYQPPIDPRELYIAAMFALYIQAPARKTGPGECVDLGEIGSDAEKNWERLTPYSLAQTR